MKKIKEFIRKHKWTSIAILVLAIGLIVFLAIKLNKKEENRYILTKVTRGDIVTTVTGTGQVEPLESIEIRPKTSGIVNYLPVKEGQEVKKGALIASVHCQDQKNSLENAKISLEKLTTADSLDVLKAENNLENLYNSGWNQVVSFMNDMDKMIEDMTDFYSSDGFLGYSNISFLSSVDRKKINSARNILDDAERDFKRNLQKKYQTLSKSSEREDVLGFMIEALGLAKDIANAAKETETSTIYFIDRRSDSLSSVDSLLAKESVSSWLSRINSYTQSLSSSINSINESTRSLEKVKSGGASDLDIRSSNLSVQSRQDSYNDCFTRALFDGVITNLTAKVGESSSSYGTLMTKQKIVNVSLNEVDIVFIKEGQEVNLTFDAINDLTIPGEVSKVYSVGKVSSGVVSYEVEIMFKGEDERIKTGMSANVEIITESREDVLTIPSSALLMRGNKSFVQILEENPEEGGSNEEVQTKSKIIEKEITIGFSNDSKVEIISGLEEGDEIISKVITNTSYSSRMPDYRSMMSAGGMQGMTGGRGMIR